MLRRTGKSSWNCGCFILVSFGSLERFGDENKYVERIAARAMKFPERIVLVEQNNKVIGQMELQIVNYEGKDIGYVHLYYLIPDYRDKGYGKDLIIKIGYGEAARGKI